MFQNHFNSCTIDDFENLIYENKLKVFGEGIIHVKPDMAGVIIGIVTEDEQLKTAQDENTKLSNQVLENIKSMGISPKDIQTHNYSINAKYDYVDGKQVFRGYTVSNYLQVFISDINAVGEIIDSAVKGGANNINNINFIVSDTSKYYREALKLAINDAQSKALAIASKLKVNVDIVPSQIIEQRSNTISPLTANFKTAVSVTPIEAGENKIIANIEVIFLYN